MRIVISQRVTTDPVHGEVRDSLAHDWAAWAHALLPGTALVPAPNRLTDAEEWLELIDPHALILSGGDDIGSSPIRDSTERRLLEWFRQRGFPVLGVCRGLQMLNAFFGGGLTTDLERHVGCSHAGSTHSVRLNDAFTAITSAERWDVNSFHNHGVLVDQVAAQLIPVAVADGGVVESLVHPDEPILAIQWHPERPNPGAELDRLLIPALMTTGRFWK
jgi:N5-(cytidine 5'-diphosphoramidyl)-L-glutamine hydrolase